MAGILFIVSAPSGAGKTSLVKVLLSAVPGLSLSVSHTTRAPRPGEIDGRDYHFVSQSTFDAMKAKGDFIETAEIYGRWYGTSKSEICERLTHSDVVLEIDWQGAKQIADFAQDTIVTIFILPPSMAELERRLLTRGQDDVKSIHQRSAKARMEIAQAPAYQFVIINRDFDEACADLQAVIRAGRLSTHHQAPFWETLIATT